MKTYRLKTALGEVIVSTDDDGEDHPILFEGDQPAVDLIRRALRLQIGRGGIFLGAHATEAELAHALEQPELAIYLPERRCFFT